MTLEAPPAAVRLAWRSLALSAGIWAIHALFTKLERLMHVDLSSMYGGHYQFLTNLGMLLWNNHISELIAYFSITAQV